MTVEETFNNYLGNYHRQFDQASTDDVNRQLLELVIGEIEPDRAKFFEEVTRSQVEAAKERAIERENFQLAIDAIDIPGLSWGQIGVSPVLALGDVLDKYTKWVLKSTAAAALTTYAEHRGAIESQLDYSPATGLLYYPLQGLEMLSKIGGNEGFDELNQRFKDIDTEEKQVGKAWGSSL